MAEARVSRDEWRKRVGRWKDSGLTAKEFAAETGLNAGTLQFWRYKLKKADAAEPHRRRSLPRIPTVSSIVQVGAVTANSEPRVEIELKNGRVLRVAPAIDPSVLKTLVATLEA
jgi:transposase